MNIISATAGISIFLISLSYLLDSDSLDCDSAELEDASSDPDAEGDIILFTKNINEQTTYRTKVKEVYEEKREGEPTSVKIDSIDDRTLGQGMGKFLNMSPTEPEFSLAQAPWRTRGSDLVINNSPDDLMNNLYNGD